MSKARDLSLRHSAPTTAVTKASLGLDNVENHSTATIRSGVTATDVGLGNVTNESKATMFTDPNFTGSLDIDWGAGGYQVMDYTSGGYSGLQWKEGSTTRAYFDWNDGPDNFTWYAGGGGSGDIKMTLKEDGKLGTGSAGGSPVSGIEIRAESGNFSTTSNSSWSNLANIPSGGGSGFAMIVATSENGYCQVWLVEGDGNRSSCRQSFLGGDCGHTHSKDISFRVSSNWIQFKNNSYTTWRGVKVFAIFTTTG